MVNINGKYALVQNENLVAYLVATGVPEEKAKKADGFQPTLEVKHEGNKVYLLSDSGVDNASSTFVLDEEVDEPVPLGFVLKSTAKLDGDTLTVTSKAPTGQSGSRVYKFSDTDLVVTFTNTDPKVPQAKRVFKRV